MTRIKICGISRLKDVDYINEVKPDYTGFVFWEPSKRNVTLVQAEAMRQMLDDSIKTVGVFVDRNIDDIIWLVNNKIISCVQLHGSEDDDVIAKIRSKVPKDTIIIKAFEVKNVEDVIRANDSTADMVLIDSGKGSGSTFDWKLLEGIKRDYFLAGGLSASNVADAVNKLHPYAVDVSSKVETDGLKDRDKIKEFCAIVRSADGRN